MLVPADGLSLRTGSLQMTTTPPQPLPGLSEWVPLMMKGDQDRWLHFFLPDSHLRCQHQDSMRLRFSWTCTIVTIACKLGKIVLEHPVGINSTFSNLP